MDPVAGFTTVQAPVGRMWEAFLDVPAWRTWNRCIARSRMSCGALHEGSTLIWTFMPIKKWMPYRMPARAKIVEFEPQAKVTWEVTVLPGFRARHSYLFEAGDSENESRFGSWEAAEGPLYRLFSSFWNAHFRFVRDESLRGAEMLARRFSET